MIIAEAGINAFFGKDKTKFLDNAKKLIKLGKDSGFDVVKFQKRDPNLCVPFTQMNKEKIVPWRKKPTTYIEYKRDIEFGKEEYDEIDRYCKELGIKWTASVWDLHSAEFILKYDVPFIKVPSAKITDAELIGFLSTCGKPLIISTGMSTEEEIDQCVEWIEKGDCPSLTILHCNSSYPAEDKELNLNCILTLQKKFPKYKIGWSGHEEGISASIVAAMLGAEVIERHITLSRCLWGTDQSASLVFDQAYRLTRDLNKIDTWVGDGKIRVYDSEKEVMRKLR